MKRILLTAVALSLMWAGWNVTPAQAASIKIAPLLTNDTLKKGEKKLGHVDISNPTGSTTVVRLNVQSFRQIDGQGSLQFFDSQQIEAGVRLDLEKIELKAYETARIYFLLDGTKLPSGDVFAAIFARTASPASKQAGTARGAQAGSLFVIVNGTPSAHEAEISGLQTGWVQLGDGLTADVSVKNTAEPNLSTGFFPTINVATKPYSQTEVRGPLVFAGMTRQIDYRQPGNYFGPLLLSVTTGSSSRSQLVFAVTGFWRWLAPLLLVVIIVLWLVARRRFSRCKIISLKRRQRV